jgi:arsenite/tail-anchored protein-transporting ATPase
LARLILFCGKGGVGKTTVAAASALAAARSGHRTIILSLDLAHSLFDSLDLDRSLFDKNAGLAVSVTENLDAQEIDVQEEITRHWGDVYKYIALLFTSTGLSDAVAEEVAVMPGTEDVITLMYVNQYIKEGKYDTIIVDCPPTGESLRFVNMTSTIEWYMLKRFKVDRMIVRMARPLLGKKADNLGMPEDNYFESMKSIFQRIDGVNDLLIDPTVTTVRLVTNAEKMVIRETQRAYMYFNMYGMTTDQLVINRLLPESKDPYFTRWYKAQRAYVEEIQEYFNAVPVVPLPLFEQEVLGLPRLQKMADQLYGGKDPTDIFVSAPPYKFVKEDSQYSLIFQLPFVEKEQVDIHRAGEDLIIRVGSFKRHVPLSRSVVNRQVSGAHFNGNELIVKFA